MYFTIYIIKHIITIEDHLPKLFSQLQGHVLREITAITRRQGTAVTAVCHDADCNIIVTGDHSK